jgi:light-regulated signal transduction histidine kinase (bacteriophytochrome)
LLKNETGHPLGFVKIIRDQTERKEHLEKIKQLNSMLVQNQRELESYAAKLELKVQERTQSLKERNADLQDFCYSIAHDLRAPLRSINAMAHIVIEDYGTVLDSKGKEYLGRIAKAGGRLDRLTVDLLDYTRFSREEIKLATISIENVIDEVLLNLEHTIVKKGATVNVQRPLPSVMGQHAYAVQIIGNLLSNAIKFMPTEAKPVIDIWAETVAGRIRIYVKDNGIGIAPEDQAKIFLLFERLHSQESFEGTGAGLAIARKAAQRMKAEVGIVAGDHSGSTFWLECSPPDDVP